jgi:hypothetical protein
MITAPRLQAIDSPSAWRQEFLGSATIWCRALSAAQGLEVAAAVRHAQEREFGQIYQRRQ